MGGSGLSTKTITSIVLRWTQTQMVGRVEEHKEYRNARFVGCILQAM